MFSAATSVDILRSIREKNPLIHNITNQVVTQFTANLLLSLGASPAMVNGVEEVEEFVQKANSLVINMGTLSADQTEAMLLASRTASQHQIPWVLDPVALTASTYRSRVALELLQNRPSAIRGNASEIISLHQLHTLQDTPARGRGVDSTDTSEQAIEAAKSLAQQYGTILSISGETDYITDGHQVISVQNSHSMLTKVTGTGCGATAITAACLAVEKNRLYACATAMAFIGIAADIAMTYVKAPGSLQIALLNEIYLLNEEKILKLAKLHLLDS